nr:geranylgeranyl transferase type-2 subunit alpha 1 [Tanacetum cinerariifolium]
MHGRPRKSSPTSAQEENVSSLKANKIKSLQSQFLHNHQNKIYTQEALDVNEKLIEANPEFMTAWNYRKLAFEDKLQALINEELRVVENALKKNFKSYGAWHHRKWVVSKGNTSTEREIGLLNKFQVLDNRNFHAWNYRRFIAELKNIPDEKELKYTTDMIDSNFSNYSAWHNRSVLLSHLLEKKAEGYFPKEMILKEEYDYVRSAVFTDEDDQSGWFYHLWLLDQTVKVDMPTLVSSWPPHGYDINQVTFPVVLYFDEPVEGVSSHTVTVQTENDIFKNVTWTPLSTNKSKCAQAWMTHLSIPHEEVNSSKNVKVKVSSEMSDGIISLSGVTSGRPWSFGFTVSVCQNPQPAEGQNIRRLSYADESFCTVDSNSNRAGLFASYLESKTSDYEQSTSSKWKSEMIATEIDHYRDLLTWAESKKIGKLTLARLLMAYDAMMSTGTSSHMANMEEVLQLYTELMELDPAHNQYYKDEYSLAFLKQVMSSKESLLKYCCEYKESTSSNITDSLCLRLSNLSLSRIGSFERLLWVQNLDLSHNQLHSIE